MFGWHFSWPRTSTCHSPHLAVSEAQRGEGICLVLHIQVREELDQKLANPSSLSSEHRLSFRVAPAHSHVAMMGLNGQSVGIILYIFLPKVIAAMKTMAMPGSSYQY